MSQKSQAPSVVRGADCLNYIDKAIGFGNRDTIYNSIPISNTHKYSMYISKKPASRILHMSVMGLPTRLSYMRHDTNKRIIGLVTNHYEDGGLRVVLLGDETLKVRGDNANCDVFNSEINYGMEVEYVLTIDGDYEYDPNFTPSNYPPYIDHPGGMGYESEQFCSMYEHTNIGESFVDFDNVIDFVPTFLTHSTPLSHMWSYKGYDALDERYQSLANFEITNDKNNTVVFGEGVSNNPLRFDLSLVDNPLTLLSGNLYDFICSLNLNAISGFPYSLSTQFDFDNYVWFSGGRECSNWNLVCIPYNLILTENESFALEYLNSGALPPDAYLYPLDWENLPGYQPTETEPEDNPDDNTPDDNSRSGDPNPPQAPTYTPSMLSNYNWYWLSVPDYSAFLTWFWNDIGNYNDFSDLIAKVEGLYNDVASAVLMVRYFPVEISWIGGLGTQSNIKVGMIEKNGAVDTISQAHPPAVRDIGNIHIPTKYNSFCDLAPYTELSLYLPFHGFIDMDIDILMGHDLYIKGVYDYLTGTLQYMVYVDNLYLINTVIVKLAVDIPITLQTKNDRDSAVFSNVTSTVGGLIGAGVGMATGNPIGITMGVANGVQSLNANNTSAPLNVKGTVGESGALYCPPQCAIILRRPTIQSSDGSSSLKTWKKNVGNMCGYGYTLSSLVGKGLTVCYTPRINFTKSTPMQSEVEEIYTYLQEGVIL